MNTGIDSQCTSAELLKNQIAWWNIIKYSYLNLIIIHPQITGLDGGVHLKGSISTPVSDEINRLKHEH